MELFSIRIQRTFQLVSTLYDDCKDLNEYLQQTMKKQKNNHLKIEEQ